MMNISVYHGIYMYLHPLIMCMYSIYVYMYKTDLYVATDFNGEIWLIMIMFQWTLTY